MIRDGLDAPTVEPSREEVEAMRAFLDGQSRIKLAVWVRHEHEAPDGPTYDHHVMLAVDDEDCATEDMRALDSGLRFPRPHSAGPTWVDLAPASEVEALRSFGAVLWEQATPGSDPLDYRFTHEPITVAPQALAAFRRMMPTVAPQVVRVTATRSRLWKGEAQIEDDTSLCVACDFDQLGPPPGPLQAVQDAAREAGIAHDGGSLELPAEPLPHATVLYERDADA